MNDFGSLTTRVCGNATVAAMLGERLEQARAAGASAVVCWSLRGVTDIGRAALVALEVALTEGLRATKELLATARPPGLDRIALLVDVDRDSSAGLVLSATVGAFAKSLARELARERITVNAVGGDLEADGESLTGLLRYLSSDAAGFVTGQVFGSAGARLGSPMALASRPSATSATSASSGWVLVSGGAGAIGGAISRALHREGFKVVIGHVSDGPAQELARELSPDGATCRTTPLDLMKLDALPDAARALVNAYPDLHGLVLCGGWNRTATFATTEPEEWHRTLVVNLLGPAMLTADVLAAAGGTLRAVVAIGSESSRIGDGGRALYAGSKAGVASYMSRLAATVPGCRAATIAPGPVDTPLLRQTHGSAEAAEKGIERLARLIPLGRLGEPHEIASAVSFFFSAAGAGLDGEVLSVGGGITMQ